MSRFGMCGCPLEDCQNDAVIECRFQSHGLRRTDPVVRYEHIVERSLCWPCLAVWTEQLKRNARRGIGLDSP